LREIIEMAPTADSPTDWEEVLRGFQQKSGLDKLGPIVHPTRVAMTGKTYGPGLFELMAVLGPDRVIKRALRALSYI
jgi:glutamyl-tRNA synthetase